MSFGSTGEERPGLAAMPLMAKCGRVLMSFVVAVALIPFAPAAQAQAEESAEAAASAAAEAGMTATLAAAEAGMTATLAADEVAVSTETSTASQPDTQRNSWRYTNGKLDTQKAMQNSGAEPASSGALSRSSASASDGAALSYVEPPITVADATSLYSAGSPLAICIDVSYAQGNIDWGAVAADGVEYAIIQCGYGSNYANQDDRYFLQNVEGARAAGIGIGVYLYSYATTTSMATSEGKRAVRLLQAAGLKPSDLALPVYYDMEDASTANIGAAQLGYNARAFCSTVAAAGFKVGIYANADWWANRLTSSIFNNRAWSRWVAAYPLAGVGASCPTSSKDLWQFASNGICGGINGDVDMNFVYRTYEGMKSIAGGSATLSATSYTYTGANKSPKVSKLKLSGGTAVASTCTVKGANAGLASATSGKSYSSWTLTYASQKNVGTGTVYIWGNGAYSGCIVKTFTIKPAKVMGIKLTAKSKGFKVKWASHKTQTTGFQVRYSTKKTMAGATTKTVTSKSAVSKTVTKLKSKKTYYVQVRAYTTVNGKKYYSAWSTAKKIKTLK